MAENGGDNLYGRVFGSTQQNDLAPDRAVVMLNDSPEAEERAQRVMKDIAGAEGPYNAWAGPAREDEKFYNGHQWDDVDRLRMEQLKRPAIVFNEIKPTLDAISGLERLNRQDVRFVSNAIDSPVEIDVMGDLATEAVSKADDLVNGPEENSRVAKDAAITGMGWAEIHMDYNSDINGRVVYEQIPKFEMRWDPNSRKENLEDSEWRARVKNVKRKMFEKLWPDKLEAIDAATSQMPYGGTEKYELVTPYYSVANQKVNSGVSANAASKKDIEVIQYQWRDMQPVYRFQDDESGEIQKIDQDKYDRMKSRMSEIGMPMPPMVKQMQPIYRQTFVCRGIELEEPVDLPGGFSFLCITGQWDEEKKRWYGIVRPMLDPQKTMNKAMSAALTHHITNAKGGVLFKTGLFADPIDAKNQWSKADAWIEVNDTANLGEDFIQRKPSDLSPEVTMFFSESKKAIAYTSGVNEELIGLATGQTPSQTANRRVSAGLVVLGWYFDNLNRHRREKAKMQLEFIREFWSQGQFIQVGGDFNSKAIPLLKESLPTDYSLVLDDSIRHNPNLKSQIWDTLIQSGLVAQLAKFGLGKILLAMLKFSPFPTAVVQQIQQMAADIPPPPQKGGGGKKGDPPEMQQAKTELYSAQAKKALSQAAMIDQQTGLKAAELMIQGMDTMHKAKYDQVMAQNKHKVDMQKAMQQGMSAGAPNL